MLRRFVAIFLVVVSTSCENRITKCCNVNELLTKTKNSENSTVFTCINKKLTKTLPLVMFDSKYNVGIPDGCFGVDRCVDKTVDGDYVELYCNRRVSTFEYWMRKIKKCCPFGMVYNNFKRSCENSLSYEMRFNFEGMIDVSFGMVRCDGPVVDYLTNGTYNVTRDYIELYDEVSGGNVTVWMNESCFDSTLSSGIVRSCRKDCTGVTCLRKCCDSGKSFMARMGRSECVETWEEAYSPETLLSDGDKIENIGIIHKLNCRKFIGKSNITRLFPNGIFLHSKNNYTPTEDGIQYCLEKFFIEPGAEQKFPMIKNGSIVPLLCALDVPKEENKFFLFHFIILVISCIFLFITLLVYIFLPDLKNTHGKIVMSNVSCMLVSFLFLAVFKSKEKPDFEEHFCYFLGYTLNYTLLSTFSWLNVMCFDIWHTFGSLKARVRNRDRDRRFLWYSAYAFGFPAVLTAAMIGVNQSNVIPMEYRPLIGIYACWYNNNVTPKAKFIFLILPMGLQILSNMFFFAITVKYCVQVKMSIRKMSDTQQKKAFLADKKTLMTIVKLSLVMGISWISEIISTYVKALSDYWVISDFLNISQGFWIFIIFVCKPKVWRGIKQKLGFSTGIISTNSFTASSIVKSTASTSK